jgi:streptomycin 6-kinase
VAPPVLDDGVRHRLVARFGPELEPWLADLPGVLAGLAERWHLEWGAVIPRGSMSVVVRCRLPGRRPCVVKVSPDRARLAHEAAALGRWTTVHTPTVLAVDESLGALLIEEITPGTPLVESGAYPSVDAAAGLLTALQTNGLPDPTYPPLTFRVEHLFASGGRPYERNPVLLDLIPRALYERGHRQAARLAAGATSTALLHGDLTPSNILDGGDRRGLVAIDPAPCLGDPAFDAVDLVMWQADDVDIVGARAEQLASALDFETNRLLAWCTAFAGMTALELAASPGSAPERVAAAVTLAETAFTT